MKGEQSLEAVRDEYDLFLDTWEPSNLLKYSTLSSNLYDPFIHDRLIVDPSAKGEVERTPFLPGVKLMTEEEARLRKFDFLKSNQDNWSDDFRARLLDEGLDEESVDSFIHSFSTLWIDGSNLRQSSPEMLAIKASIRDHDRFFHSQHAGH